MFVAKALEYLSRKFVLTLTGMGTSFYLAVINSPALAAFTGALAVLLGFYQGQESYQKYLAAKHGNPEKKELE